MANGLDLQFHFIVEYRDEALKQISTDAVARYEVEDDSAYLWWTCLDVLPQIEIDHLIDNQNA